MYNLLVWKWIDEKFDIKWMYLLCFIFVDTAFLLCGTDQASVAFMRHHYKSVYEMRPPLLTVSCENLTLIYTHKNGLFL